MHSIKLDFQFVIYKFFEPWCAVSCHGFSFACNIIYISRPVEALSNVMTRTVHSSTVTYSIHCSQQDYGK
jgi:hypothetical protein